MNIIMGLSFKSAMQRVLHSFTFHCQCVSVYLLHISVCKLTRKLQFLTLISPKSWERCKTHKLKKSFVIIPPYISNVENDSSLDLLLTSCRKYLAKPSLGKSYYNFHFFHHRFTQGFEINLEIDGDGGVCFNSGSKHGSAKY